MGTPDNRSPPVVPSAGNEALLLLLTRREQSTRLFLGRLLTQGMEAMLRGTICSWADIARKLRTENHRASLSLAFAAWQEVFIHQCVFRLRGAFEAWVNSVLA